MIYSNKVYITTSSGVCQAQTRIQEQCVLGSNRKCGWWGHPYLFTIFHYCYKHSSEIKYSTLFQSGVFSIHHFVAILWFLFWRSSVIYRSIGNWFIANCFVVGGYEHKCVVLRISIRSRSVALVVGEQPESSWASHKLSSRPLLCSSRRSGHTPHQWCTWSQTQCVLRLRLGCKGVIRLGYKHQVYSD
jgi:hypothetical protein